MMWDKMRKQDKSLLTFLERFAEIKHKNYYRIPVPKKHC